MQRPYHLIDGAVSKAKFGLFAVSFRVKFCLLSQRENKKQHGAKPHKIGISQHKTPNKSNGSKTKRDPPGFRSAKRTKPGRDSQSARIQKRRGMGCKPHRCGNTAQSLRSAAYQQNKSRAGELYRLHYRFGVPRTLICARQKRRRFCYTRTNIFQGKWVRRFLFVALRARQAHQKGFFPPHSYILWRQWHFSYQSRRRTHILDLRYTRCQFFS